MDSSAIEIIENPLHNEKSGNGTDHEPTHMIEVSVNSKEIARVVLGNLSCKHFGLIGFATLLTMLLVSAVHLVIFFAYAGLGFEKNSTVLFSHPKKGAKQHTTTK